MLGTHNITKECDHKIVIELKTNKSSEERRTPIDEKLKVYFNKNKEGLY